MWPNECPIADRFAPDYIRLNRNIAVYVVVAGLNSEPLSAFFSQEDVSRQADGRSNNFPYTRGDVPDGP